jgi:hypothetical protein
MTAAAYATESAASKRVHRPASAHDRSCDCACGNGRCLDGAIGVGFALIVAPIAAIIRPDLLPGAILILMLPLNAFVAWRERSLDMLAAGAIAVVPEGLAQLSH